MAKRHEKGEPVRYERIKLKHFLTEFPLADVEIQVPVGWKDGVDDIQMKDYPRIHNNEFQKIQEKKLADLFLKELKEKRNIHCSAIYTCNHEMFIAFH